MRFSKAAAAESALDLVRKIISACGIRFAGTESCNRAGAMLQSAMDLTCDHTHSEEFEFHPGALMSYIQGLTITYVIGTALLFVGAAAVYVSFFCFLAGFLFAHLQFNTYRGTFDFLFPKAQGRNVYGVIEPEQPAVRQIIISGHHDSACVCRYLLRRQKLFPFRIIAMLALYFTAAAAVIFWSIFLIVTGADPSFGRWIAYAAAAAGAVLVVPMFFIYKYREGTPGAGDNLIASAAAVELSKYFSGKTGGKTPQNTRLIFLSTDAEEPGLKGARAFVAAHLEELRKTPTSVINLECLYELDNLGFTLNDCNGFVHLSEELAERCFYTARDKNYPARLIKFPFGGGATDAAEYGREGIDACTILGMSTDLVREGLVYHTPNDTVDAIEPAVVEAVLDILHTTIMERDNGQL